MPARVARKYILLKALPPVAVPAALALTVAAPSWSQGAGMLEEVVVTATKRQQTLQEIPVAVSVVTAQSIEQSQVLDIKDLQTLVPSLRVSQLQGSNQTSFIIRGFGNGANNAGIEPSVGVFIDGVYRSRVGSALADLPKLERVEVLRGPQSTLFGKNASAGVISVVTAKPDISGYSGSVGGTLGNYSQTILRGDVTGPITIAGLQSVRQRQRARRLLRQSRAGYRAERASIAGISAGSCCGTHRSRRVPPDRRRGTDRRSLLWYGQPAGWSDRGCHSCPWRQPRSRGAFSYETFTDFDPGNEIETQGTSLQFDYDFDSFTLTSIIRVSAHSTSSSLVTSTSPAPGWCRRRRQPQQHAD
jgi:iron complex outermembrane receptor protein